MEPTFHTRGTVCGGDLPPSILSQCPKHACAENELSLLSSSPPPPYTPQMVMPAVPPRLGKLSYMSKALHMGAIYPTALSFPLLPHDVYADAPPETPSPFNHHTPNTLYLLVC